jgi:hypothetical protein
MKFTRLVCRAASRLDPLPPVRRVGWHSTRGEGHEPPAAQDAPSTEATAREEIRLADPPQRDHRCGADGRCHRRDGVAGARRPDDLEAGAFNFGYSTQIIGSTISGNTAGNYGGGVVSPKSFGTIRSSTLYDNHADYGGGARSYYDAKVKGSTVSGNVASLGGGLFGANGLHVYSSIVANNDGRDVNILAGILSAQLSLFEYSGTTIGAGAHNIVGVDPNLGHLQNNGGNTPTLKPGVGSPVVDQGHSYSTFDQRLGPRTVDNPSVANVTGGDGTDIGSVELSVAEGTAPPPPTGTSPPATPPPTTPKKKCKKHKKAASAKKCKKKKKQ